MKRINWIIHIKTAHIDEFNTLVEELRAPKRILRPNITMTVNGAYTTVFIVSYTVSNGLKIEYPIVYAYLQYDEIRP
jgi:hypothetical protein